MAKKKAQAQTWRNRIVGGGEQPASQFMANPANARIHPKQQQQALIGSLNEIGWIQNVIVNKTTGNVVDGHARIAEALKMGDETPVPYVEVELSEDEEKLALATLDPISAMAAYDKAQLDTLLRDVNTGDAALQTMLAELAQDNGLDYGGSGGAAVEDVEPQIDKAGELQKKWQTARGQLWRLGDHRLLCGDSTSAEDVARVMGGEKADAVVTDPPYGVGVQYATFKDTESNTESVVDGFMPIVLGMNCPVALTPGVPVMWAYPQPAWVMVWVHPAPVGGCSWGFAGVNPILVYGKDPYLSSGKGRRPDHIVMAADREGVDGHPTPKPIKVWLWLVERLTTKPGQIVFEPFNGSGTTIMACEQLGRKCRAVEISPEYVAVALERWSTATGKTPELMQ